MLGQDLQSVLRSAGHEVTAPGRADLDVTSPLACAPGRRRATTLVVNAAAYTKVDDAESHEAARVRRQRDRRRQRGPRLHPARRAARAGLDRLRLRRRRRHALRRGRPAGAEVRLRAHQGRRGVGRARPVPRQPGSCARPGSTASTGPTSCKTMARLVEPARDAHGRRRPARPADLDPRPRRGASAAAWPPMPRTAPTTARARARRRGAASPRRSSPCSASTRSGSQPRRRTRSRAPHPARPTRVLGHDAWPRRGSEPAARVARGHRDVGRRGGRPAGLTSVVDRPDDHGRRRHLAASRPGAALPGVSAPSRPCPCRVLVVDNASTDGTSEAVLAAYPSTDVLRLPAQPRLRRRVSTPRMAQVRTPFVALLNNDAVADPGWLAASLDALRDPRVAAVDRQAPVRRRAAARSTTPASSCCATGYGADRGLGARGRRAVRRPRGGVRVLGWSRVLRTMAVRAVGGFAAEWFMYYEDTDLSWRLRLAGWRIVYAPRALVRHRARRELGLRPRPSSRSTTSATACSCWSRTPRSGPAVGARVVSS